MSAEPVDLMRALKASLDAAKERQDRKDQLRPCPRCGLPDVLVYCAACHGTKR